VLDPEVFSGKPIVRGHDDMLACLAYARDALGSERVFPTAA
jgi:uncharacterized protein (DUF433 family)